MKTVHAAYIDDDERYWFASIDGVTWMEVGDDPRPYAYESIAALFEPKAIGCIPSVARRYLNMRKAVFCQPGRLLRFSLTPTQVTVLDLIETNKRKDEYHDLLWVGKLGTSGTYTCSEGTGRKLIQDFERHAKLVPTQARAARGAKLRVHQALTGGRVS